MIPYKTFKENCLDGAFANTPDMVKILEWVAYYHVRNGKEHSDGSMGEIRITPKEFRNLLAYIISLYSS